MLINSKNTCKALEKKNWSGQIFFFFYRKVFVQDKALLSSFLTQQHVLLAKLSNENRLKPIFGRASKMFQYYCI